MVHITVAWRISDTSLVCKCVAKSALFPYHCLVVDLDDFVTGMYPGALVGRALESDVSYHVGAVEGEGLEPDPEVHGVVIGLPFGCRYVQASRLQCKKKDWSQRELRNRSSEPIFI